MDKGFLSGTTHRGAEVFGIKGAKPNFRNRAVQASPRSVVQFCAFRKDEELSQIDICAE